MALQGRNFLKIPVRHLFWTKKKPDFGKYAIVQPGNVSASLSVPDHIQKPTYYYGNPPEAGPKVPEIKSPEQITQMHKSCQLAASILKQVGAIIKTGLTTNDIDNFVHNLAIANDAYPSPLRYHGFPKSVCTSINNVACHGIPDDRPLEDGDIINVDITVYHNGYHGDCSKTFPVGHVDEQGHQIIAATEQVLSEAIKICKPNEKFSSIGCLIEQRAYELGFNVVPCFLGHGIGTYFHGAPDICHFTNNIPGTMAAGMTFTIEPVLTKGQREVEILDDGWTAVTIDEARTAQAEHTILITSTGCETLTQ